MKIKPFLSSAWSWFKLLLLEILGVGIAFLVAFGVVCVLSFETIRSAILSFYYIGGFIACILIAFSLFALRQYRRGITEAFHIRASVLLGAALTIIELSYVLLMERPVAFVEGVLALLALFMVSFLCVVTLVLVAKALAPKVSPLFNNLGFKPL